jgi:glycosyltransferase
MKISVITATWNSALTVEDTIKSVIYQDYSDIEYIIIDGASTDSTLDLIKSYGDIVSTLVSEKDKGIYDALNKGIGLATGDVVGFLHSDDVFADESVISRVAEEFSKGCMEAVYGDLDYVSRSDTTKIVRRWVSGRFDRDKFRNGWMPPHPTFYLKRKHYVSLGGFNLKFSIAADYDSMLRYCWKNKINAGYIPEVLIKMRVGGESNRSLLNIFKKTREDRVAMIENGIRPMRGLLYKNLSKIQQFF